ncbi:MAG: hypothetical protein IJM30_04430 [Thermoguttaceae bacterium]|nr:hypothetical protein [Thermoguttaceae bacterium]
MAKRSGNNDESNENQDDSKFVFLDDPNDERTILNRSFQDALFGDRFQELDAVAELNRALRPYDTKTTKKDISLVTVKNILTVQGYNDLGYLVGDEVICLVEAQSRWDRQMPMRLFDYLHEEMTIVGAKRDIVWTKDQSYIPPEPDLHVLYSGSRKNVPDFITMNDAYWGGRRRSLWLGAQVHSKGRPGDMVDQYLGVTRMVKEQVALYGPTTKALDIAINLCIERGYMSDYMKARRAELVRSAHSLFDNERQRVLELKREKAESFDEGFDKGFDKGVGKGKLEALFELVQDGELTITKAAKRAQMTVPQFKKATAALALA